MRTMVIILEQVCAEWLNMKKLSVKGINVCTLPDDHSEACFAGTWKISAGGDQFFRGEFVYLSETGGDQYQNSEGYLYDTEVSS